jgi:hypothetical protein
VFLNTPSDPARTCAIANFGVKGVTPGDLAKTLAGVHGVRVTPHVFIQPQVLDTLVAAIREIART